MPIVAMPGGISTRPDFYTLGIVFIIWLLTMGISVLGMDSGQLEVNLIEELHLHNATYQGVTLVTGMNSRSPAIQLSGDDRALCLTDETYQRVRALLQKHSDFTLVALIRQEEANSGAIISFAHGYHRRYLELQSSTHKDEIRFHYTSAGSRGEVKTEIFPYRLASGGWHRLALVVSGSQVDLFVDCQRIYQRVLSAVPLDRNFTIDGADLSLWLGQRNRQFLFKGSLQDVSIVGGPRGYLKQCPQLDSTCPTCGEFSLLQATVLHLEGHIQQLTSRLEAVERRISTVEECDCQRSCRVNGSIHADGASWQHECDICSCISGDVQCRHIQCTTLNCKNPVLIPGECCPICLKQCLLRGVLYDHGESVSTRQCVDCECVDGSMQCQRLDPKKVCPDLPCNTSVQFNVPGKCCKFCPGEDYCSKGHTCHANASCLNLQTTFACQCAPGFTGNGHFCQDMDECKAEGGLEGHHCHSHTVCLNVEGTYSCECESSGYVRVDRFNCGEKDECATGEHACHLKATCVNTHGSYKCVCAQGYSGDGFHCQRLHTTSTDLTSSSTTDTSTMTSQETSTITEETTVT